MSVTQVLARKWRPKSFAELAGQEHVVKALVNALDQKRLHHAYLFSGTRGVGKTTLARILAKSLNCAAGITSKPCGVCPACIEIDEGRFIDLLELDAASNTQVDNMRELLENALYAPTSARFKVYIIDEVHMLSKSAFNAMLKTLEEPPQHVKFVLATTDPQKIPVTVLSRCLQFNLKQIPPQLISAYMQRVLDQERIAYDLPSLQLIARAAQGSMRDALSLLDQALAHSGGRVEESAVREMLGVIGQDYLYAILNGLVKCDGPGLIAAADAMESRSLSFEAALQDLASLLHRVALAQTVPQAIGEETPDRARIFELAKAFDPEQVQLYYQIALHGRDDIGLAPDEYAGFTMTLLRMLSFRPDSGSGAQPPGLSTQDSAVGTQQPGPSSRDSPPSAQPSFDGDWPALAARLKLDGMAKMLARHCELKSHDETRIELRVPPAHRYLLEKAHQDKLTAAVRQYLGRAVSISFSIGGVNGNSPAELENREKQAKQAQAAEAIGRDPFVRELIENFDARLIESSIKPNQ